MIDKELALRDGVAAVNKMMAEALHLQAGTPETHNFLRSIMDPKHLLLYDLALRCETEMLKCDKTEAFFAGCLMGAAMNEALLSLLCLFYEDEVKGTKQYTRSTKNKTKSTFREIIAAWSLDQLIHVAEQLSWIPRNVAAPEFALALADAYRELAPISYPGILPEAIEERASKFEVEPGPAMLRMLQELRNTIHSGKWLRGERILNPAHFDGWCRIAIHVSAEIRSCLVHLMAMKNIAHLTAAKAKLDDVLADLRSSMLAEGRDPAEFERLFSKLLSDVMKDRKKS
jgi:hypothetical protein